MPFSGDEYDRHSSDSVSTGESESDGNAQFESVFCVGNFCIDISQFHNFGKFGKVENHENQGWVPFHPDQAKGTVITDNFDVKAYTLETAQNFEQEQLFSHPLYVLLRFVALETFYYSMWAHATCCKNEPITTNSG